ncbi:MAG: class II aldolase/adducin family protein [SAR86 cluster bacterium]|jgi:L-ribulose-5-phosphate 4-epimerase|tara:strand:+ start:6205 stop:6855 length:651 start_codon:yes stop_codon:yes gene_type:complete
MEHEGVIKFHLEFIAAPAPQVDLALLNNWRRRLQILELLGEIPGRYAGLGFGNLSQRQPSGFLITGSQTSGVVQLPAAGYALVTAWDLARNHIVAQGQVKPSSESLTHAVLYGMNAEINVVFHVHSPLIWHAADVLALPMTDPKVAYGTPEMAAEVQSLMADESLPSLFCMGGHEDGVVTLGRDCQSAGQLLIETLNKAVALLEAGQMTSAGLGLK